MIRPRQGRDRAITMHEIAEATGMSTREVQAAVKSLVEDFHVPIGTAMQRPFGYFFIRDNDERRRCRDHFIRRAMSNLNRAKAYDSAAIVAPLIGQIKLQFGHDGE